MVFGSPKSTLLFFVKSDQNIMKKYHKKDKRIKNVKRIVVTFVILALKFLNLYAWILSTIKNHQTNAKTRVYNHI